MPHVRQFWPGPHRRAAARSLPADSQGRHYSLIDLPESMTCSRQRRRAGCATLPAENPTGSGPSCGQCQPVNTQLRARPGTAGSGLPLLNRLDHEAMRPPLWVQFDEERLSESSSCRCSAISRRHNQGWKPCWISRPPLREADETSGRLLRLDPLRWSTAWPSSPSAACSCLRA